MRLTESKIEDFAIKLLELQGYEYIYGPDIAPDGQSPARNAYGEVVLQTHLQQAVQRLNPAIPFAAQEQAIREVLSIFSPELINNNQKLHTFLTDGVAVEYQHNGQTRGDKVWLIDFDTPTNNEFLIINQFTIIENNINKRPDLILFINGLPLVVIELKNAASEQADLRSAYNQLQTYKETIPSLFIYNALLVISDGLDARAGALSAGYSRFSAWKTADGQTEAGPHVPQLEVLIKGLLNKTTLLDLIRHFIVFEKSSGEDLRTGVVTVETVKKVAAYHQYHAVNEAVRTTLQAAATEGNRKGGVFWHTQGSGKSLSMVFYAGKLVLSLNNPTLVVITDRNDLDDQLFDTFAGCSQLLRQPPVQASSRSHLIDLLKVASGGIVFTTIQKFFPDENQNRYPQLSDRRNIIVMADEAHRTQYGLKARQREIKDDSGEVVDIQTVYGFAKHMRDALPNATFIGFTGTPIESTDINTPALFGNYVDVYNISQAVDDGATVPIYYESRLAKVALSAEGRQLLDDLDEELESEDMAASQKARAKWTTLEAIVGHPDRLRNIAEDILTHFGQRQTVFTGKAMIVAMSRRIAVDLYQQIIALRPDWDSSELDQGQIKVIMTASSADGPEMERHHTTKNQRRQLASRFKDPQDSLQMVIVIDMWLTGFDAPCLHTLYIDKPMKGHGLMQAIARVNRVYGDKPGGHIVDYIGIAAELKKSLKFYAESGVTDKPTLDQEEAANLLLAKLEVVEQMMAGLAYQTYFTADTGQKLSLILQAQEHILRQPEGKTRYNKEIKALSSALALSIPHPKAMAVRETISFFQAVNARLQKFEYTGPGKSSAEIETAVRQVIDQAIVSDEVVDIFDAAGIQKPDVSILSDDFLAEVRGLPQQNVALELLKKLLNDELRTRRKTNLVQSKKLSEMLEDTIHRYQNNLLTTAEVLEELINLAKEIQAADNEGAALGLSPYELAFYHALASNDSAQEVLGTEKLKELAVVLVERIKQNTTIDWSIKESVRARMKVMVKRLLRQYGYPPDMQAIATEIVLEQAKLLADFEASEIS
ncbi:MAG: type I restriction endonuclease subunit R [Chloroflexota bacterium]